MNYTTLKSGAAYFAVALLMGVQTLTPLSGPANAHAPILMERTAVNYHSGDVIPVTLDEPLSSSTAHRGDMFTATVDVTHRGYDHLRGASITGHVSDVVRSHDRRPGQLGLQFDSLRTRGGKTYQIDGSLIGLDTNSIMTNSDGTLVAQETQKHKTLEYAGYGAGAGAVLGILGGGGLRLGTILLGAALGAAGGQLSKGKTQQHDVDLKQGLKLGVRLDKDFDYPNY